VALQGTCREVGDVAIVDFSGKITLGEGSAILRKMIRELVENGRRKILLDLGDVDYIDSSGIGEMVAAYTTVRNAQGELKLVHLTRRVHDILQITRLYTVFDVQGDEASALRSFRGTRVVPSQVCRLEPHSIQFNSPVPAPRARVSASYFGSQFGPISSRRTCALAHGAAPV
jgi:anti-sigma B factor antagonist